jgi:hypothetical protein
VQICQGLAEPSVEGTKPGDHVQFERVGYFCADSVDSKPGNLVFNRVVTLRDSWAAAAPKEQEKKKKGGNAPAASAPAADIEKAFFLTLQLQI